MSEAEAIVTELEQIEQRIIGLQARCHAIENPTLRKDMASVVGCLMNAVSQLRAARYELKRRIKLTEWWRDAWGTEHAKGVR